MKRLKNKKVLLAIAVFLFALALNIFGFKSDTTFEGEIEGTMVSHSAEVSGKLLECPLKPGDEVKKGDMIAVIDDTNQKYVVEQLELNLEKVKLAAGSSSVGKGGLADDNYAVAKAAYDSAVVLSEKAKQDYDRAKALYDEAATSRETLDGTRTAYETATSSLKSAKAKLSAAGDKAQGSMANIDVRLLESQLAQQKNTLEKHIIKASCDGVVMSKNYTEGDMVAMGYNILDISAEHEKYAVIYFPKDMLDQIAYNQRVQLMRGNNAAKGTIKFIDIKAQYTPKELQTAANRNQECVRVKILIPNGWEVNIGEVVKVKL